MTCIIGLRTISPDRTTVSVTLGADSAALTGYTNQRARDYKLIVITPELWVVGAGAFRLMNVVRHRLTNLPKFVEPEAEAYMVTVFIPFLIDALDSHGALGRNKDHSTAEMDGHLIVALRGELFDISGSFDVIQPVDDYIAAGLGDDMALGALYATVLAHMDPEDRVRLALGAAVRYSTGVSQPFNIRRTPEYPYHGED